MSSHYTLAPTPAFAKTKDTNRWIEVDISDKPLKDLFALYRKVEVPVFDFFGKALTLFLYDFERELKNRDYTLSSWFERIADRRLDLTDGHPSLTFSYANYVPVNYHSSTIKPAKAGYHPTQEVAVEDYDDLIIDIEGYDPAYVTKHCLFSVNGFVFPSKYQDYGVRVLHAADAVRDSQNMEAGFLNFEKIGAIRQVPITKNMITKIDESKTWFDRITIDTTEYIGNKTVGIVLGGYLHLLDGLVKVIGPNTLSLSMRNYNLRERVMNSMKELDLEFMGLDQVNNSVPLNEFLNEENVVSYLTSKYSFLVLIDNTEMSVDYEGVSSTAMLGTYIIPKDNRLGRLVDHIGKGLDYWPNYECGQWALKTTRFNVTSDLYETNGWEKLTRLNDAAVGHKPTEELQVRMINYFGRDK